jgi:hypothetical protein
LTADIVLSPDIPALAGSANKGRFFMAPAELLLLEAERGRFRVIDEWVRRLQAELPPLDGGASAALTLRQWAPQLGDFARSAQETPKALAHMIESAWDRLDAGALTDPTEAGRALLGLLAAEIEMIARVADFVRIWPRVGRTNPKLLAKKLEAARLKLLDQARDFRDSWPWPTGEKPDDPEDAAGARRAMQELPSFEALARLAEQFPPPPEWLKGE